MASTTKRGDDKSCKGTQFLHVTEDKLLYIQLRMLKIIPMVTTKKIAIEKHQRKLQRYLSNSLLKTQLNTKYKNAGNERQKSCRACRKQITQ